MKLLTVITAMCCFLLHAFTVCAQIQFVDSLSNEPIMGVNLLDTSGNLVGVTMADGQVKFFDGVSSRQYLGKPLTTSHVSYDAKPILIDNLDSSKRYHLHPIDRLIPVVAVKNSTSSGSAIALFTCYYRSYDRFDEQTHRYSDGIIEIYVPLAGGRMRYKLLDGRVFLNQRIHTRFKEVTKRNLSVSFLPDVSVKGLSKKIRRLNGRPNASTWETDSLGAGYVRSKDGRVELFTNDLRTDSISRLKLFAFEVEVSESWSHDVFHSVGSLADLNVYDLDRINEIAKGRLRRGKDTPFIAYENANQLYVLDREIISKEMYQGLKRTLSRDIWKWPEVSSFSKRFWEDVNTYGIPDIPKELIGRDMEMVVK